MTPVTAFKGKSVAVFGLGGSGFVTAQALVAGGARVNVWDDNEHAREKARAAGLRIENLAAADWSVFEALILSPGVPLTHPAPHWTVIKAKEAGIEVIGDIELFCRERRKIAPGAPFVAITGTNGKSTTTALVAHLFSSFGFSVEIGGNIGTPILALAPPDKSRVHVIECSSYQIDLAPSLDPSVGILLNVTPDHLDRHGTMENYAAIKARLVAGADHAVIGVDDEFTRAIAARLREAGREITLVSAAGQKFDEGIIYEGGRLFRREGGRSDLIADLAGVASLRGAHNGQNAAVAIAALGALGRDHARVAAGLASFPGLAHRLEEVGRLGKVLFVNDSKATNADAAEKALLSFDEIFWILGGRAKQGGIEPLRPLFGRIVKAYLIGEASEAFAQTISGAFPVEFCETLENAVPKAAEDARASALESPVVLLSPACASFDQFPDFEKRGDRFRALAKALMDKP
ncbi:UDP-N-acetylmuramoylalanine--D-glutamate ligase [Methylocella tundrae]|uniref:UDP-N-acetylmuramoylalanine--D-glutamate ligase n=1 Tax=Methylocella tundrae TaxID=227605 RepID=A0A8B6M197_METTU|nr:UDP-N-acetylmuramoyl-L-alanine--D-glutamate ligase [Methylocella tundrae]VTZ48626.1 UDP-N-acetylmuramoylalanine--D-glutamate ligase [Methylocella tundrae]